MVKVVMTKPVIYAIAVLLIMSIVVVFAPLLLILPVAYMVYVMYQEERLKDKINNFTPVVYNKPSYNQFMTHGEKMAYLKTDKWRNLVNLVRKRDNYQCQNCGSHDHLETHHITYERLGDEHVNHLVTLCNACHTKLHQRLGYSRNAEYPLSAIKED